METSEIFPYFTIVANLFAFEIKFESNLKQINQIRIHHNCDAHCTFRQKYCMDLEISVQIRMKNCRVFFFEKIFIFQCSFFHKKRNCVWIEMESWNICFLRIFLNISIIFKFFYTL